MRLAPLGAQRPAIYCEDSYDFSVALFAVWQTDAVPLLPPNNTRGTVAALTPHVDCFIGDLPNGLTCTTDESGEQVSAEIHYAGNDNELILFTSGSTGDAKRIRKTVGQLEDELDVLNQHWEEVNSAKLFIATVSHQHIYGLLFKVLLPLTTGRTFESRLLQSPSLAARVASRHGAVLWVSSPAQLKRLDPDIVGTTAPTALKCITSSGGLLEKPAADLVSRWLGQPAIEVYGSTESGGIAWRQQSPSSTENPWQPLPGVSVRTIEENALLVQSPWIDVTADACNADSAEVPLETTAGRPVEHTNEWFTMGDAAEIRPDGSFFLKGRIDRIVKIEEKRVSLEAIEAQLRDLPQVSEVRCLVLQGERDALAAVAVLSTQGETQLAETGKVEFVKSLRTALSVHFERVTLPRRWRFVAELPVNEQGKIVYSQLLNLFTSTGRKLLPEIIDIRRSGEDVVELDLRVPPDLAYLEGHFPDQPIVPGVVQITWARHFGMTELNSPIDVFQMKKVKFKRVVHPGDLICLRLSWQPQKRQLTYRYESESQECSSGVLQS